MSSSTWRKVVGFLVATAVGILGGELFFLVVLGLKGLPIAQFPFWAIAKIDWMFAGLAVFPWFLLGRKEGYAPVWLMSLLFGGGMGVIAGAMTAFMFDPQFFILAVTLIGGLGLATAVTAASFLHITGLFGNAEKS